MSRLVNKLRFYRLVSWSCTFSDSFQINFVVIPYESILFRYRSLMFAIVSCCCSVDSCVLLLPLPPKGNIFSTQGTLRTLRLVTALWELTVDFALLCELHRLSTIRAAFFLSVWNFNEYISCIALGVFLLVFMTIV